MEKRMNMKGIVTPLSSVLPPEEARKAANKVAEAIGEKEGQLNHLNHFVADNANLINIVKRLPDELHHDIMVPFGKAAFFPGRLIHTNEFLEKATMLKELPNKASEVNLGIQAAPKSNFKVSTETSKPDAGPRISRPITDSLKAFSGSIIEHTDNLPTNPIETTPSPGLKCREDSSFCRLKLYAGDMKF